MDKKDIDTLKDKFADSDNMSLKKDIAKKASLLNNQKDVLK